MVSSRHRSGRTMARTGLRMMPTFPSSPLRFRTAGFPQYGSKAGLSDGAFPCGAAIASLGLHPSFVSSAALNTPRSVSRFSAPRDTAVRAVLPPYPRGPRSGPGYSVPVHHHLLGPIRPTRRHAPISPPCELYAAPSLCRLPGLGRRRAVPSFRCHSFSACRPQRPRRVRRLRAPSSSSAGFAFVLCSMGLGTLYAPL